MQMSAGGVVYSVDTSSTHTVFDSFAFFSIIFTEAKRDPIFFLDLLG